MFGILILCSCVKILNISVVEVFIKINLKCNVILKRNLKSNKILNVQNLGNFKFCLEYLNIDRKSYAGPALFVYTVRAGT